MGTLSIAFIVIIAIFLFAVMPEFLDKGMFGAMIFILIGLICLLFVFSQLLN